jgi:hypothetical protein
MAILFTDYCEFATETGRMKDWRLLERLGFSPKLPSISMYELSELPRLKAFCREHPEFHIMSYVAQHFIVNRIDRRAIWYALGDGNSDPDLCYLGRREETISLEEAIKHARTMRR